MKRKPTSVALQNFADQQQPESLAVRFGREERRENLCGVFVRYSGTIVGHYDLRRTSDGADCNGSSGSDTFYRVFDNIYECLT